MEVLASTQDQSVNFVIPGEADNEYLECRYVRRTPEKVSFYVSSQYGCDRGCRMCHLTRSKQTSSRSASYSALSQQLKILIDHYKTQPPAEKIHLNFMARGEPLENGVLRAFPGAIRDFRLHIYRQTQAETTPIISTIMPWGAPRLEFLEETRIYYSLYSIREAWRKQWFPKALPLAQAVKRLQGHPGEVRIHLPLIAGENDDACNIDGILLLAMTQHWKINLIRFNPYNNEYQESPWFDEIAAYMAERAPTKVIERVGEDVHASCGVFYR